MSYDSGINQPTKTMNKLQIGDKVFTSIKYQDGWVWVDKDADISVGLLVHGVGEVYKSKGYFRQVKNSGVYKVIAQSPDLDLEGVTVVEVSTAESILNSIVIPETYEEGDYIEIDYDQALEAMEKWAAQSKGCYTEEQVLKAIAKAQILPYAPEYILQSIQPEIVVETTCIRNGNRNDCANETCWDLNECQKSPVKPVTYQKNGRTYFKLKQ